MTNQPDNTAEFETGDLDGVSKYAIVTMNAQQAVLPRKLEEGVYAILDAEGGIQVVETDGYAQQRKHDWERAHSDKPEFVHRAVTLLDVDSFIAYLTANTYAADTDETADPAPPVGDYYDHGAGFLELWANIDDRKITAILDGYDGLRKHTATLALKVSREWAEWAAIDGKLYGQVEFAQFIEDHLSTIGEPDGAKLLDICQTLEATKGAQFRQQNILASGQRTFRYEETVEAKAGAKGDLTIPGELTLVLRPFQGSDGQLIKARFRFRPDAEGLRLGVKLAEPDKVLEDAFNWIVAEVQGQVPVHINHGRP